MQNLVNYSTLLTKYPNKKVTFTDRISESSDYWSSDL